MQQLSVSHIYLANDFKDPQRFQSILCVYGIAFGVPVVPEENMMSAVSSRSWVLQISWPEASHLLSPLSTQKDMLF